MSEAPIGNEDSLARVLNSGVQIPRSVVWRTFPSETIVLNLASGQYHALNPTAALLLDGLQQAGTVPEAATALARSTGQPREVLEAYLRTLCDGLLQRGLLEPLDGDAE